MSDISNAVVSIRILSNLGLILLGTGRNEQAEIMQRDALVRSERTYGPDSELVASKLEALAQTLIAAEKFSEAELLCRRRLKIIYNLSSELGTKHDEFDSALQSYLRCMRKQNITHIEMQVCLDRLHAEVAEELGAPPFGYVELMDPPEKTISKETGAQ